MVLSTNECGCTIEEIVFTYDNGESGIKPQINYCPLHKSASDMYEALKRILNTGICDICYEDDCGGTNFCSKGKDGDICDCHESKEQAEQSCYKALLKAGGKDERYVL